MEFDAVLRSRDLLRRANASLQPELLSAADAGSLLEVYAEIHKLASFGLAALTRKVDDPGAVAKATGTPYGKAKTVVDTGRALGKSEDLAEAMRGGEISLEQASEIARAEEVAPGSARDLLGVAREKSFNELRNEAQRRRFDAEQARGLAERQRRARRARSHTDPLGMVHIELFLEPHVGAPIAARAEAEAGRRYREAKRQDTAEPFERHLADAYAAMLRGRGRGPTTRPELVVLVSHEVVTRGWKDVREGEVCKIPGVGPVAPEVAREIARDAFLNGVFYDGKDLRHFKRWSRHAPVEVAVALELGEPPAFDGVKCTQCGARFRNQRDHLDPHVGGGPTSTGNLDWKCPPCHAEKTERDRKDGKLRPPAGKRPRTRPRGGRRRRRRRAGAARAAEP